MVTHESFLLDDLQQNNLPPFVQLRLYLSRIYVIRLKPENIETNQAEPKPNKG